jgi:DNA-binding transcriptional regulator YiaG
VITPAKKTKTTIKLPEKTAVILPKQKKISTAKVKGKNMKPIETPFPDPLTGDSILAWRTSLGETQAIFAIRINVFPTTVPAWEKKGKNKLIIQSRSLAKLRRAWELTHK